MTIPPHELQAFLALAHLLNFTKAAELVHISQSALSQRIQSLEKRLGTTLFVRAHSSIKLTEASIKLLSYCQAQKQLELELMSDLTLASSRNIGGHLRIAAYSSILQSVIVPTLAPMLREHPSIHFEFSRHDINELPQILMSAKADFVIIDTQYHRKNIQTHTLGHENYVLVQSTRYPIRNIYLDYTSDDDITHKFFEIQNIKNYSYKLSYVDDIEGVLRGVSLGLGEGIVPLHLLDNKLPIKRVTKLKSLKMPVILHYFKQPYYTKLQELTIKTLCENSFKYL